METYVLLGFVLILSIYLGLELIAKVPSTLHTPLMSVELNFSNKICISCGPGLASGFRSENFKRAKSLEL